MRSPQQALLTLLHRARTLDEDRLMLLACLLRTQLLGAKAPFYDFLMVNGRLWSFSLSHDLHKLAADGWLAIRHGRVAAGPLLTGASRQDIAGWSLAGTLPQWWRSMRRLGSAALRARLAGSRPEAAAQPKRAAARDAPAVMTAGYQGMSLEAFLGRLLHARVALLIDVRANPTARRFGFHRSTLARCCQAVGIRYEHVPDLGIGTVERRDQTTPAQRSRLFRSYVRTVVAHHSSALATVTARMRDAPCVLVCLEADPMDCHRTHLGRLIAGTLARPLIDLGGVPGT